MDQASVLPAASCARNPAALRTSSSCSRSADQSQTAAPPPARSAPQSEPHAVPSNRDPRPSSLALCRIEGKGYLLPDFYSGATGRPGRFSEGLLLRRLHLLHAARLAIRFDVRPTRSALEPRDLIALGRNRSLQCRHLFQKLQNQVLQLGRRQTVNILRRRHAHKESDSRRLVNLIIIPLPRLLPLLLALRLTY